MGDSGHSNGERNWLLVPIYGRALTPSALIRGRDREKCLGAAGIQIHGLGCSLLTSDILLLIRCWFLDVALRYCGKRTCNSLVFAHSSFPFLLVQQKFTLEKFHKAYLWYSPQACVQVVDQDTTQHPEAHTTEHHTPSTKVEMSRPKWKCHHKGGNVTRRVEQAAPEAKGKLLTFPGLVSAALGQWTPCLSILETDC